VPTLEHKDAKESRMTNPSNTDAPLSVFTDEALVERLYELSAAISKWEWVSATESPYEEPIDEIAEHLVDRIKAAAAAVAVAEQANTTTTGGAT
jgi:hypothetical protein